MTLFFPNKQERLARQCLIFMGVLAIRNKYLEYSLKEDLLYEINTYSHWVRPNMLKAYIAINQPAHKIGKHLITDIKLSTRGNSPITFQDECNWFTQAMNEYFDKYLGIKSVAEAQKELNTLYKPQRTGKKLTNPQEIIHIWGSYHLLQHTHIKSKSPRKATRTQAQFIDTYLQLIEITPWEGETTQSENIRGRLQHLLNHYNHLHDFLPPKEYKGPPNADDKLRYW